MGDIRYNKEFGALVRVWGHDFLGQFRGFRYSVRGHDVLRQFRGMDILRARGIHDLKSLGLYLEFGGMTF